MAGPSPPPSPELVLGLAKPDPRDANGNQTAGLGRSITYSSYNKPASITQGTQTISFLDDTEHQRFQQVTPSGTTLYIAGFGVLAELSGAGTTAAKWTDYLAVGNAKVGMRVLQTSSATLSTRYFHTDHLGSISVITDENGNVLERLSYDAWGKRRFPNGTDDASGSITSQTTRGFTGEEELSVSGLVHLNGRVYDPLLARFTSADPSVSDPTNPQGWNRYSYVGNDPLAFTDPNGFSWLSGFFHSVGKFFSGIVHSITHVLQTNTIVRSILQLGLNILLSPLGPIGAAISAIVVTGLSGGSLSQILKAGLIAGVTAFAFQQIGDLTPGAGKAFTADDFNPTAYAENVAGHALVGCGSAVASGGKCGAGALSGAIGSAVTPLTNTLFPQAASDLGQRVGGTILEATAGGFASVAGGGKFANGAITAAFGYLYNNLSQDVRRDCGSQCADDRVSDPTSPWLERAAIGGFFGRVGSVLWWIGSSIFGDSDLQYADRVRARALEDPTSHNFPYGYDAEILETPPIPRPDGYTIYQKPGFMNDKPGVFEIGVTKDGVIDHRFFRPNK